MADDPIPDPAQNPATEPASNLNVPRLTGRPVYESTLLPTRKHRRFSPWLVIPALLIILVAILYFLVFGPKPRRFVPTAGTVVYESDTGSPGAPHLFLAPIDSGESHSLTRGAGADTSPVFSADGSQIVFLSNRAGGQNQVYVMDADGKNVVQVTRGSGAKSQPAFAPGSNSLLGFLSGASLAVINIGKGGASLILPPPVGQSAHPDSTDPGQEQTASYTVTGFAWKPAGSSTNPGLAAVLETSGVQTLAVLPSLGSPPRLTQNDQPDGPPLAAADSVSPAWAPDGSKLVVALLHVAGLASAQRASGMILLDAQGNVVHDAQGKSLPPIFAVRDPVLGPQNPVFSPDGSRIAFELWRQVDLASRTRLGLFLVPVGGGAPVALAKGDAGSAQFSRDGRQILFLGRRRDGGHDLFWIDAEGKTAPTRISDGRADVASFAVSPQGSKL